MTDDGARILRLTCGSLPADQALPDRLGAGALVEMVVGDQQVRGEVAVAA